MILTRTPYRISFIGGGSDYPSWYSKYGGETISTTIDKYIYVSCRTLPSFYENNIRFVYSKIEEVSKISQIVHPAAREIFKLHKVNNVEVHYDGDLPSRSGMGSSSAFIVGLHNCLNNFYHRKISKGSLLNECLFIEQKKLKENVGSQDQTIAVYGGFKNIIYKKDGSIHQKKITIKKNKLQKLEENLFLIFTGITRFANKVVKNYVSNLKNKKKYYLKIKFY